MRLRRVCNDFRIYRILWHPGNLNFRQKSTDVKCIVFHLITVKPFLVTPITRVSTGSAMLRTATGSAPIKIHKADVADPERFKNLMNTLEIEKVIVSSPLMTTFLPASKPDNAQLCFCPTLSTMLC